MRRAAILVLLGGMLLSGCGGDSPRRVANARALLASASRPIDSAVLDGEFQVASAGDTPVPGPATVRFDGPYVRDSGIGIPRLDWKLGAKVEGFGVDGRLVSTGENVLLSVYGDNYEFGAAAPAIELDPRPWFNHPRYAGEEDAGGVDSGHVTGQIRGSALAADLEPLAARADISGPLRVTGTAGAWIGFDDHVIHRLALDVALTGQRGGRPLHVWLNGHVEVSDVGETQKISVPGGGGYRPISVLLLNLRDLGISVP